MLLSSEMEAGAKEGGDSAAPANATSSCLFMLAHHLLTCAAILLHWIFATTSSTIMKSLTYAKHRDGRNPQLLHHCLRRRDAPPKRLVLVATIVDVGNSCVHLPAVAKPTSRTSDARAAVRDRRRFSGRNQPRVPVLLFCSVGVRRFRVVTKKGRCGRSGDCDIC